VASETPSARLAARDEKHTRGKSESHAVVAAYVRVSSRGQDFASQRSAIEQSARARGDTIQRWYSEKHTSGTLVRPKLDNLRRDARAGEIAKLYVFRLDRLTRTGIRDTLALVHELREGGVKLQTIADGFDVDGVAGDVVMAVMAWAAQMERAALGERIRAARERIEAEGGRWGRPRRVDRATLERARKLRAAGHTLRYVAQVVKVPRATIARALREA
jgi:DNA invertase Pin-like site-specific DNA recombinase